MTEAGREVSEGHLEAISGPVQGGRSEGHLRSILAHSGTLSGPLSRKPHKPHKRLHLAVGRAYLRNILNMGPGMGPGRGTGIALPAPPSIPHPGYTPPHPPLLHGSSPYPAWCTEYGRGAHIRRPTHLREPFLRHSGYYRGL